MEFLAYSKKKLAVVAKKYGLRFVMVHGSFATGKTRADSDLDIAAVARKSLSVKSEIRLYGEMSDLFQKAHCEVDFKMLNKVDPFFRYEVVRDGVLLFGDPVDYEEYKAVSHRLYDDVRPLLDLEAILSKKYQRHLNSIAMKYASR